jgi:hypothetical protein
LSSMAHCKEKKKIKRKIDGRRTGGGGEMLGG